MLPLAAGLMFIITAWDETSETHVRASSRTEALAYAKDLVNKGMRISIVRTSDGESVDVTELGEDADRR